MSNPIEEASLLPPAEGPEPAGARLQVNLSEAAANRRRGGGKLARQLARRIHREIIAEGWPVGKILGTEPDLLSKYQVGRSVFREAVRLLEQQSVAEMRQGNQGGLTVVQASPDPVIDAAAMYLEYEHVTTGQLFEARIAIELAAMTTATQTLTESGVTRLRSAVAAESEEAHRLSDNQQASQTLGRFHLLLGELSSNPALNLMVEIMCAFTYDLPRSTRTLERGDPERISGNHREIAEAMIAGDIGLAGVRLRNHLRGIAEITSHDLPGSHI